MKAFNKLFLCIILSICVLFSSLVTVSAVENATYLARISYLSAVFDEHTERAEFYFETTGTLYHEQQFSVSVTCSALKDGVWHNNTLLTTAVFGFDGCVTGGNVVEGSVALSKTVFDSDLYKDFVLTVEGESVDMGDFVAGIYYDLDTKSVPLAKKQEPVGAFFTLSSSADKKALPTGAMFLYTVKPTDITRNISGGLSSFAFTLNYNPQVLELDGVSCHFPRGTGWNFTECGYVSNGFRVCVNGQGFTADGDVSVVFRFRTLQSVSDTELYALDIAGGDSYGHRYEDSTAELLLAPTPAIKQCAIGDVNADGCIDSSDAAAVLKYDAGISYNAFGGDVNADGYVDSTDAAIILKYDAGIIDRIGG